MEKKAFERSLLNILSVNQLMKICLISMTAITLLLIMTILFRTQPVVVIPPNLTEKTWLDKNQAGSPYLQAWAVYIATALGNATPATVDLTKEAIAPFLSPKISAAVIKSIDDQIDQIKRDRISLSFTPSKVLNDQMEKGTFFVEGIQTLEGIQGQAFSEKTTFTIKVAVDGYRPMIVFIGVKKGNAELPSEMAEKNKGKPQKEEPK